MKRATIQCSQLKRQVVQQFTSFALKWTGKRLGKYHQNAVKYVDHWPEVEDGDIRDSISN